MLRSFGIGNLPIIHVFVAEYMQGSQVFVQKIRSLAKKYGGIRRIRGDGNCFIRC